EGANDVPFHPVYAENDNARLMGSLSEQRHADSEQSSNQQQLPQHGSKPQSNSGVGLHYTCDSPRNAGALRHGWRRRTVVQRAEELPGDIHARSDRQLQSPPYEGLAHRAVTWWVIRVRERRRTQVTQEL